MSVYMTEQEQIEMIKKWWQRYSTLITILVSLTLLTIAGFRYWNWHQQKIAQDASNTYEHLMVAFSNQDNKGIRAYANQLIQTYPKTVYADAAHLTLAKLYVNKEKFDKAGAELRAVAMHSKIPSFKQIAKIRLSRLYIAEKSYDKALQALANMEDNTYQPLVYEIEGDIYNATGKRELAMESYQKAMQQAQNHGIGNLFLEMKSNELAAVVHPQNTGMLIKHVAQSS